MRIEIFRDRFLYFDYSIKTVRFKKAQLWSYDLVIGSIIFLVVVGILSFFWWSISTNISMDEEKIITASLESSDMLLTPGIPDSWSVNVRASCWYDCIDEWNNVQQVGLISSTSKRTLDPVKLVSFYEMSYSNYSRARAKAKSRYDYYISLNRYNGTEQAIGLIVYQLPVLYYAAGLDPATSNAKTIVKTERIAIYQIEVVRFKLLTWTSQIWD